jgi:transcriptional regulator with XRE-family HTH domain
MSEMALLGANLREAREYLGLTPRNVAERLEISEEEITAMEAGERVVGDAELESLASLYRCSAALLRGNEALQVPTALVAAPGWDNLSDTDRAEVIRFAYFLQHTGRPPCFLKEDS